jgi:hypothetical protein
MNFELIEFDRNYYDDEYCLECGSKFGGLDDCVKITDTNNGKETFMCIECFSEFKKKVNVIPIK